MKYKYIFFFVSIIIIVTIILLIINNDISYAQDTGRTPDVQLLARAINGEARGESYEGQVAVRSRYFK